MTGVTVLAVLVGLLLAPLVVSAVRQRGLGSMAARNIGRRRGEAVLIVAGSLLGTAIITSSFVVGDIIDGSMTDNARTQLGPIDLTVTAADPATRDEALASIQATAPDGIDGLLPASTTTVALEAPAATDADTRVLPTADLVELDLAAGAAFGGDPTTTGLDEVAAADAASGLVLNVRTAERLEVAVGDPLRIHAYGTDVELPVTAVVPEVGLAGYGDAIVPPGTLTGLIGEATTAAAPPREHVLVSLTGGVFDTRERGDAAEVDLHLAVMHLPDVEVEAVKAALLDDAERTGATFTELFSTIGAFSVIAGLLLLINLFVMLAEERKTELGMLRAVGFTRRRLVRAFALEGAMYAVVAAAIGAVAGIGIGWIVAQAAGVIFGIDDLGLVFRLVVEPGSILTGGLVGLTISLVTIWLTSIRIARLNIIRAIRDLPEPKVDGLRLRTAILASLFVLVGAAASVVGYRIEEAIPLLVGVPVAAFAAGPLLRQLLPERPARVLTAGIVLAWGVGVFSLFGEVMTGADMPVFVVQGVVLTAGAVSLAATLDTVWARAVDRLASSGRGLSLRLGLAYPLARRFRTSMLLSMFSLVIFTMTFIATMSAGYSSQTEATTAETAGGFDLVVETNPANPVAADDLAAIDGVEASAAFARNWAQFSARDDDSLGWMVAGFDEELVAGGAPELLRRDPAYGSDEAVYRAVLDDPHLAIVPDWFLQEGGPSADRVRVGTTFSVLHPATGEPHELTVAALSSDWLFNGVMVSRELTAELFGAQDVATRHYLAVTDEVDADALAQELNVTLLAHGADAQTFTTLVDQGLREQSSFLSLLQGFLGLGLLVGVAGLGVVLVRAVRERRREIGMLRAMGFQTGLVRSAFLSEAGLIALQGTVIGAALGLVTARQVLSDADAFGESLAFTMPWAGLAVIVVLPLLASLAAAAWPATRAAAIRPAIALRTVD